MFAGGDFNGLLEENRLCRKYGVYDAFDWLCI